MLDTFNASRSLTDDISLTDALEFFKTKLLQNINTLTLGEVISVDNAAKRLTVISLINGVDSKNKAIIPPYIYDVPYGTIRGGNAGVRTQYKKGDTVIIGFCQRQIESTKRTGKASTPTLIRFHNLADAVVLAHWSNDEPDIYIEILDSGITIQGLDQDIEIITTGKISANSSTAEVIASTSATVTAPAITLNGNVIINGNLTVTGAIVGNTLTVTAATINGIPFTTHTHGAGSYSNGGGAVSGRSGVAI
jgi:hypothetical protein